MTVPLSDGRELAPKSQRAFFGTRRGRRGLLVAFEASESRAASELGLTLPVRLQVLTLPVEVPQWGRTPTGEFWDSATGSCILFCQWNSKSGATTGPGLKLPCLSFKLKLNFKFKLPAAAAVRCHRDCADSD